MNPIARQLGKQTAPSPETALELKARRFHRMIENLGGFNALVHDAVEKQAGEFVIDRQFLAGLIDRAFGRAGDMACDTAILCGRKHYKTYYSLDAIKTSLRRILAWQPRLDGDSFAIAFPEIDELDHYHETGGVFARLAEVRQRLGLLIPDGFVITFAAFDQFATYNGLDEYLHFADARPSKGADALRDRIRNAGIPAEMRRQIADAAARLSSVYGGGTKFMVYGAAFGEEHAGRDNGGYRTFMAAGLEGILDAYVSVVAGMFSESAVADRQARGLPSECFPAVSVSRMIPSEAEGIIQTVNPDAPHRGTMRISVSRNGENAVLETRRGAPHEIEAAAGDPPGAQPLIEARDVAALAEKAMRIERYFKGAQEIFWARDAGGDVYIIRTRPLAVGLEHSVSSTMLAEAVDRHEALYRQEGKVASPGIAEGHVRIISHKSDLQSLAEGAVLVAETMEPDADLVLALQRAAAILTDKSEPTGHAAALAREFHVPAITGLGDATRRLADVETVTVDADENTVYRGAVAELLNYQLLTAHGIENESEYNLLRFVLHRLSPAGVAGSGPRRARLKARETLDGIMRYCMDLSCRAILAEMKTFRPGAAARAPLVQNTIGLKMRVLDAGGGLEPVDGRGKKTVGVESLLSRPFLWFWRGLTDSGFAPDVSGGAGLGIVSDERMVLCLCIGTRSFILGAFQGDDDSCGGYVYGRVSDSAPLDDANRRSIMWMKGILEKSGFDTYLMNDGFTALRRGAGSPDTAQALTVAGGMIGYAGRRADAASRGASVEEEIQAFINKYRCEAPAAGIAAGGI